MPCHDLCCLIARYHLQRAFKSILLKIISEKILELTSGIVNFALNKIIQI
jgi:hypothetical protein